MRNRFGLLRTKKVYIVTKSPKASTSAIHLSNSSQHPHFSPLLSIELHTLVSFQLLFSILHYSVIMKLSTSIILALTSTLITASPVHLSNRSPDSVLATINQWLNDISVCSLLSSLTILFYHPKKTNTDHKHRE